MDEATITVDGVDYVGLVLQNNAWICYRCDDPQRILRYIHLPADTNE